MKKAEIILTGAIIGFLILPFLKWNFDIANWDAIDRFSMFLIVVLSTILGVLLASFKK